MTPAFGGQYSIQLSYGRFVQCCAFMFSQSSANSVLRCTVLPCTLQAPGPAARLHLRRSILSEFHRSDVALRAKRLSPGLSYGR